MTYSEKIRELTKYVPVELIDFSVPREPVRAPTQASSNFITNKEQGDWAEELILRAINGNSTNYVAVKYGKSDDIVAGEDGFDKFFEDFQNELDTFGKRPDLLVFSKKNFKKELGNDISSLPIEDTIEYVKLAIAGIEVRSSSFLIEKYEKSMQVRTEKFVKKGLEVRDKILKNFHHLLDHPSRKKYIPILNALTPDSISVANFKVPGWSSTAELQELNSLFKELKRCIKEIQKRDYLSITPKVEDIKVVYKWIEKFNVPHFYFQVFFDKIYGMSFEQILSIISNHDNEGEIFSVERDTKNQNKTTIKIKSKSGLQVAYKIDEPNHKSVRKEMDRGRLLFYVTFSGGTAYLDVNNFCKILDIPNL
ncbi:MAG: AccI family restriction endonuclease [Ignavibacteriales bacterium]|nr:MAG: AccI family restriction endonuclease [Ignavibacteriaceae bacterium]MBW7872871.1 AccI family restriction endonuclease [Ignavibacteria bacterium]MCZ2142500.1 AccI family restriction endonuclease [Ignavibacteriales bacterium]OQY71339.1 MAG: restriction endonuclease [Ignavibacteriales bacterium UTCHB3]MBV6445381.1 Type-2 restriction enzyme AccI [Ignavibacteriaceae bacterium]